MKAVYKPVLLLSATLPGIYASENIPIAITTASDRSSPAMQYMQQLYRSLADENGNAKSASVSGLSVWCLVDKGELYIDCHIWSSKLKLWLCIGLKNESHSRFSRCAISYRSKCVQLIVIK